MVELFFRARVGNYEKTGRTAIPLHAGAIVFGQWLAVIEMASTELATDTAVSCVAVGVVSAYNVYANKKADVPAETRPRA